MGILDSLKDSFVLSKINKKSNIEIEQLVNLTDNQLKKLMNNNIHNFILLPSFVVSFIYSYICIDPLLQIRYIGCGMNSYQQIVCE